MDSATVYIAEGDRLARYTFQQAEDGKVRCSEVSVSAVLGALTPTELRHEIPWGAWDVQARAKLRGSFDGPGLPPPPDDRHAMVAWMYRRLVADGVRDPCAELARRWDVKPQTVRSWVLHARRAGALGPALGRRIGEGPR